NHSARSCGVVVESITPPTLFMKNVAPSATQWEIDSAKPSCTACTAASATGAATPPASSPAAPTGSPLAKSFAAPATAQSPPVTMFFSQKPFPSGPGAGAGAGPDGEGSAAGGSDAAGASVVCAQTAPGLTAMVTAAHARVRLARVRRRLAGRMGELLEVLHRGDEQGAGLRVVGHRRWSILPLRSS